MDWLAEVMLHALRNSAEYGLPTNASWNGRLIEAVVHGD
jgi:hypothetical protein